MLLGPASSVGSAPSWCSQLPAAEGSRFPKSDRLPGSPRVTPRLSVSHGFSDLVLSFFHSLALWLSSRPGRTTSIKHTRGCKQHTGHPCPRCTERHGRRGEREETGQHDAAPERDSRGRLRAPGTHPCKGPSRCQTPRRVRIVFAFDSRGLSSVFPSGGQKCSRSPKAFPVRLGT